MSTENTPEVPAWTFVMIVGVDGKAQTQIHNNQQGLPSHDVAKTLTQVAGAMFGRPDGPLFTVAQKASIAHAREVVRDYPAVVYYPEAKLSLCVPCHDLFDDHIEGDAVDMPPGSGATPCSFHLDPSKRPFDNAEAIEKLHEKEAAEIAAAEEAKAQGDQSDA